MSEVNYTFRKPRACNMCGAEESHFQVLGMRLNQSQGFKPKARTGIAVGVRKCRACGLIFADPQPIPRDLQDHYGEAEEYWPEDYYVDDPTYFRTEIDEARALIPKSGELRALDIGAGIGKAMQALSRAWLAEVTRRRYTYNFAWLGRPVAAGRLQPGHPRAEPQPEHARQLRPAAGGCSGPGSPRLEGRARLHQGPRDRR